MAGTKYVIFTGQVNVDKPLENLDMNKGKALKIKPSKGLVLMSIDAVNSPRQNDLLLPFIHIKC